MSLKVKLKKNFSETVSLKQYTCLCTYTGPRLYVDDYNIM